MSTAESSTAPHGSATLIELGPGKAGRVLCVADIRGDFKKLNEMIRETKAVAVIHTGDFGFLDGNSPSRMSPRVLRHTLQYTPLISDEARPSFLSHAHGPQLFSLLNPHPSSQSSFVLSQLGALLSGDIALPVPVYAVYGPTEDVRVLEKFRTGEYEVKNLMVIDEAITRLLDVGGVKFRLMGLGGSLQMSKIFDNGEGVGTIAGGSGMVWATALQIGELVDSAQKVHDPTETRILVTHSSVGREGLLAQLAMMLKADFTISGSLHFRFIASFNEFNVQSSPDMFKEKMQKSKDAFAEIYDSAKPQLDLVISPDQREYLAKALAVSSKVPSFTAQNTDEEDGMWKNTWNWNLAEAGFGDLILIVRDGRVSAETHSSGFNFAYRRASERKIVTPNVINAVKSAPAPIVPTQSYLASQPHPLPTGPAAMRHQPPQQRPIPQGPSAYGRPPYNPALASRASSSAAPQTRPLQPSAQQQAQAPTPASGQSNETKAVNGVSTNGHGKVDSRSVRDRPTAPAAKTEPLPAKPAADASQTAPNRKQKIGKSLTPVPNGSDTITAASSEIKSTTAAEKAKSGEDGPFKDVVKPARDPRERKERQPREPREPREPRDLTIRSRGPKSKDEKSQATSDVNGAPSEDAGVAADTAVPATKASALGTEEVESSEKPSPSSTPRPPSFTLYVKGLPRSCSEDEVKSLWDVELRSKIIKVKIPIVREDISSWKPKGFAYVEFETEQDMQAGLAKHEETLNGQAVQVVISNPPKGDGQRTRGGRGGRGGVAGLRGGRGGRPVNGVEREQKDVGSKTTSGGASNEN